MDETYQDDGTTTDATDQSNQILLGAISAASNVGVAIAKASGPQPASITYVTPAQPRSSTPLFGLSSQNTVLLVGLGIIILVAVAKK